MVKNRDNIINKKQADIGFIDIAIPQDVENMQLPNPELLTFYRDYDNRILWIDSEINNYSLEYAKYIMQWNKDDMTIDPKDRKKIVLLFFSPGGDLDVNNLLVDTISMSKTPIIGINCGIAASAGCFIYLSCHERYTFPNAQFLIHQGAGSFEGTYDIVISAIMNYQREIENLGKFVLSRTNIPEDVFYENFATDWYLDAEEALEYGLCSKIITSLDEIFVN